MRLAFGLLLIAATISLSPAASRAEENQSGHYFPGATSSFIDMLPDRGATYNYANVFTFYHGSGDLLTQGTLVHTKGTSYSDTSVFLYQAPTITGHEDLGQYAVALAVPYEALKVTSSFSQSGKSVGARHVTDNGFGDIVLFPVMMGWKYGDWKYQTQFGIYVPTGHFNKNDLADIGKNYWTFEPSMGVSYLQTPVGPEFSVFAGFDFNTKNGATRYQTGDQFHVDGTLAEHFTPFSPENDFFGLGVNGFFYQQITGDSGSGAKKFGSFEAMTTGIGPVFSYIRVFPKNFIAGGEVKWVPELSVSNRLSGNIVWVKLAFSWGAQQLSPEARIQAL